MKDKPSYTHQCDVCCYGTDCSTAWSIHCTSKKHITRSAPTDHACGCGRTFHSKKAKTFHQKKCTFTPPSPEPSQVRVVGGPTPEPSATPPQQSIDPTIMMQMFQTMMDQNQVNQNKLIEAISSGNLANNTTNNNTTNNTQNNTMNLNVFLDEHCKDAMNLTDFFDKIKVHQSDLPDVLRVKNPKAISNILQRELGKLSITERPIHCTDVKRKKMFVKDNDKWTSEQGTDKIDKVINSTCAHQYNTWGVRVRNTDREDRAEQHYDDTAAMGAILGKQMDGWGEPGNRLMQETQNDICNMVYLTKEDARDVVNDKIE